MKQMLFFGLFFVSLIAQPLVADSFFFKEEGIVREGRGSLKEFKSFVFFPFLKMEEKETKNILDLIKKELIQVGLVVETHVFKPNGADLTSFSNPSLQFSIEQLVDKNNKPLPILEAALTVSTSVEILNNQESCSLPIDRFFVYLKKTNDIKKVIQETLPMLLQQFISNYQNANGKDQKPTFIILNFGNQDVGE